MDRIGTVVVGADGSPDSRTAIEYALRDASRRSARLRVVAAVEPASYWVGTYAMVGMPTPAELRDELADAVRTELAAVLAAHPELGGVPVEIRAVLGTAGPVLVDAAAGADLLVVGHRGRGAIGSALLGSVGLHCVLHSTCPVTIVRPQAVPVRQPVAAAPAEQGSV